MKRTKLKDRILPKYTKGEEIFNMVNVNDTVYVVSEFPSKLDYSNRKRLSPVIKFKGEGKGLIRSATTRRDGIIGITLFSVLLGIVGRVTIAGIALLMSFDNQNIILSGFDIIVIIGNPTREVIIDDFSFLEVGAFHAPCLFEIFFKRSNIVGKSRNIDILHI